MTKEQLYFEIDKLDKEIELALELIEDRVCFGETINYKVEEIKQLCEYLKTINVKRKCYEDLLCNYFKEEE